MTQAPAVTNAALVAEAAKALGGPIPGPLEKVRDSLPADEQCRNGYLRRITADSVADAWT
jgi:hypothetical protein